jgi:PAS domain S-box-containing protein
LQDEQKLASRGAGSVTKVIDVSTVMGRQTRLVTKTPVLDNHNQVRYILGTSKNVSDLKISYEFLDTIFGFDNLPVNIFVKDSSLRYERCNPAFAKLHHTTSETVIGMTDFELWPRDPKAAESFRRVDQLVLNENQAIGPFEEVLPSGQTIETCKIPLRDTDGKAIKVLGIYYDVTDRARRRREREVEEMAMHVGHCFKDHSFFFQNELNALARKLQSVKAMPEFERLLRGARYLAGMADLVRQLPLSEKLGMEVFEAWPAVLEAIEVVDDPRVMPEENASRTLVRGSRNALRAAVLALLDNARQYATSNGVIGVKAETINGKFRLHVWDDGPGLDRTENLFSMFRTATPLRVGVGLGWVKEVSRFHGGDVDLAAPGTDGVDSRSHFIMSIPENDIVTKL